MPVIASGRAPESLLVTTLDEANGIYGRNPLADAALAALAHSDPQAALPYALEFQRNHKRQHWEYCREHDRFGDRCRCTVEVLAACGSLEQIRELVRAPNCCCNFLTFLGEKLRADQSTQLVDDVESALGEVPMLSADDLDRWRGVMLSWAGYLHPEFVKNRWHALLALCSAHGNAKWLEFTRRCDASIAPSLVSDLLFTAAPAVRGRILRELANALVKTDAWPRQMTDVEWSVSLVRDLLPDPANTAERQRCPGAAVVIGWITSMKPGDPAEEELVTRKWTVLRWRSGHCLEEPKGRAASPEEVEFFDAIRDAAEQWLSKYSRCGVASGEPGSKDDGGASHVALARLHCQRGEFSGAATEFQKGLDRVKAQAKPRDPTARLAREHEESLLKLCLQAVSKLTTADRPADDVWVKWVQAMAAEHQVEKVLYKLEELNPNFEAQEHSSYQVEEGKVTEMGLHQLEVADVSPVCALTDLRKLDLHDCQVDDLSPLRDLKQLRELMLWGSINTKDLSPLKGLPLEWLNCGSSPVEDLSPLSGMPLNFLCVAASRKVSDLSPLKGMGLSQLMLGNPPIRDLSPIRGMRLTHLWIDGTQISDLPPLRGIALNCFWYQDSQVTDISILQGTPLKEVRCTFKPERDAAILKSITTLETIDGMPAGDLWKKQGASAREGNQVPPEPGPKP